MKGWVKVAGNKGDIVPEKVQIYSSKACKDKTDSDNTDTSLTLHEVKPEEPAITDEKKMTIDKWNEKMKELGELEMASTSVADFEQWITNMEDFLDSIPDMGTDPTVVYEVERETVDDPWKYNGVSYELDAAWNAWTNKQKQAFCKKLNKVITDVTNTMTTMLQSLLDKISSCSPVLSILKSVTSMSISLTSIIDWAMGIINLLLLPLKWLIKIVETVMKFIEIITVKLPSLISKATSKITSMNCPVTIPSVQVKVNMPTDKQKEEYFERHPIQSKLANRSSKKEEKTDK